MSKSSGLGFGGFLVGLGLGWVIFTYIDVSSDIFSWLLILGGAAIIAGVLLSRGRPKFEFGDLIGGLIGGLVLSLIFTSGFGIFTNIFNGGLSGSYTAHTTKTYDGAMTASTINLDVDNFNGYIRVSTWAKDEYLVDLDIRARREEHLDDLKVDFDVTETGATTQDISLSYDISPTAYSRYAIGVEVSLPENAIINLNLESSNGAIEISNVDSNVITFRTSNGAIKLNNVYAGEINGETSNGGISGKFEAPDTSLSTSNGAIDLTLPCTLSGDYNLDTSNGHISLKVSPDTNVGYDLRLSTSNGEASINLPNLEYSTNQRTRKVAKTENFSSKSIQITIDASSSNSNVSVYK